MALEDLQSKYGPFNKKGQAGTGEQLDIYAGSGQGNKGHEGNFQTSKLSGSEKAGTKPTGADPFGNKPPEKIAGM